MRQGQPKRLRGRNRGGSNGGGGGGVNKGPNTLNRSYESNGPDVKIRGTAGTIADKYVQLSRDATSSGDPVAAENYMQHAEHYYRLLAAAQAQFQPHQTFVRADADDFNDPDEDDDGMGEPAYAPPPPNGGPQPYAGAAPYRQNGSNAPRPNGPNGYPNAPRDDGQPRRFDRNDRRDRQDRPPQDRPPQDRPFQDRPPQDRPPQDRVPQDQPSERMERPDRAPVAAERQHRPDRGDRPERASRAERIDEAPALGLPAFITGGAPAPAPVVEPAASVPAFESVPQPAPVPLPSLVTEAVDALRIDAPEPAEDDGPRPAARGRRRRYGRLGRGAAGGEEGDVAADAPPPSDMPTD